MWNTEIDTLPYKPVFTNMAAMIGGIGEYDSSVETWSSYIERFELFVECNGIEQNKKVSTFLTVVGVKTYSLLRDLCTPDKPSTKSFNALVELIQKHLFPTPSFIAERYRFSKRVQQDGETAAEYIANLKKMTTYCDFGASLNDYLRDRLVSGIRSETAKQRLLSEASLTLDQAVKIVTSLEQAEKSAAALAIRSSDRIQKMSATQRRSGNAAPHTQTAQYGNVATHTSGGGGSAASTGGPSSATSNYNSCQRRPSDSRVQCLVCGSFGHVRSQCKLLGVKCNFCGKLNHIAKICRSRLSGKSSQSYNVNKNKSTFVPKKHYSNDRGNRLHNYIDGDSGLADETVENSDNYVEDVTNLFKIKEGPNDRIRVQPVKINVIVQGKQIQFEADSGSSISCMSESYYKAHFNECKLVPSDLSLSSYTNQPIVPLGKINVDVKYKSVHKTLDLYVIKEGSHPLLGRDWLKSLGVEISFKNESLEVNKIKSNCEELTDALFKQFPEVFSSKVGCFKGDPVKLTLKRKCHSQVFQTKTDTIFIKD